jgi:hypothetical protein
MDADTRYLVFASAPLMFSLPESPKNGARIQVQDMLGAFGTYPLTIEASPANIVLNAPGTYTSSISRTARLGSVSRRSRSTANYPSATMSSSGWNWPRPSRPCSAPR